MSTLKSRAEQNAIFITRTSLAALRQHMTTFESDAAAVDRIVKEADILSGALRRLLPYVVASEEQKTKRNDPPPAGDMEALAALSASLAAIQSGALCTSCGGIKPTPEAPRAAAASVDDASRQGAMRSVAAAERHS